MPKIARLGDQISHGGEIVTASPNVYANGKKVAREGDTANCTLHGPVTINQGSSTVLVNGKRRARIGDTCSCGAVITGGSDTVSSG